MDGATGHSVTDEVADEARRHSQGDDPYLAKIRRLTTRLQSSAGLRDDPRTSLSALEDHADIDLDVPTESRQRYAVFVKRTVKLLIGWYLRYLGDQITLLGHAMVRLGTAVVDRTERLEETTAALADDVAALASRVDRLEQGSDRS